VPSGVSMINYKTNRGVGYKVRLFIVDIQFPGLLLW